ncbi:MAG: hypothetical protein ACRENN_05475 [Candidatus Eiseniibacteriota bacterium]
MKLNRGLLAGACLVLIAGCSDSGDKTIDNGGSYSPIITGVSASHEPAVRGAANTFTAIVTNVNSYPLTYHWSASTGVLTDSTHATATWDAPDSIGTFDLTVSITAHDAAATPPKDFFQTTTFHVFVDNEYSRWTTSPEVQFDPDPMPMPPGGVIFAQLTSSATGAADVYTTSTAGLPPMQLVTGFSSLTSPTMRADGQQIAFAAKASSGDAAPSIWVLPAAGGDPSGAYPIALRTASQTLLTQPRYARAGNWLFYGSDSARAGSPRPWFRDAFSLAAPEPVVVPGAFLAGASYYQPGLGPDADADGLPDSIVAPSYRFFGLSNQQARGIYKFPTRPPQSLEVQWLADSAAAELDWSPNGQYIAYSKLNPLGDRDIWIISAAAADPAAAERVTFGPADDSHPRFSPDGLAIFFVSNRTDHYGLNGIFNTERRGTNIWSVSKFDLP